MGTENPARTHTTPYPRPSGPNCRAWPPGAVVGYVTDGLQGPRIFQEHQHSKMTRSKEMRFVVSEFLHIPACECVTTRINDDSYTTDRRGEGSGGALGLPEAAATPGDG